MNIILRLLPLLLAAMILAGCNGGSNRIYTSLFAGDGCDSALLDADSATAAQREVTLAFVGDVMMGTNYPNESFVTKDRGRSLFDDCKAQLRAADFAVANLEGNMYDGTAGENLKKKGARHCFMFRMPGDHAQNLVDAGFDAVGFANNHSLDFGPTGRMLTLETIRGAGLGVSGIKEAAEECLMERGGVRYGFLQFAASCYKTLDLNDEAAAEGLIRGLRSRCDVLIVAFHGGAEGTAYMHVPKCAETYLGEHRGDVVRFAHFCIDHGADIVVGHGPHVPRAMELYKGHLVAYSLGNFCTPTFMSIAGATGLAPLLVARIETGGGLFRGGQIYSYRQQANKGPRTDATHEVAHLIRQLSEQDFPTSGLRIGTDGQLSAK